MLFNLDGINIFYFLNIYVDVCLSYLGMRCGRGRHQHHGNYPDSKETGSFCISRSPSNLKHEWCRSCHLLCSPIFVTWNMAVLCEVHLSSHRPISTSVHAYSRYDVGVFYYSYQVKIEIKSGLKYDKKYIYTIYISHEQLKMNSYFSPF